MTCSVTVFADAQKYLDMRASGWTDPTVDVHVLIQELVDMQYAECEDMIDQETHDEAVEEALERGKAEREEWEDPTTVSVERVLELLADAIERERRASLKSRDEHTERIARELIETKSALAKATRPKRTRAKAKPNPENANATTNATTKVTEEQP